MDCELRKLRLIGLARRAGAVNYGSDGCEDAIKRKKAKLIIFAVDTSERVKNYLTNISDGIPILNFDSTKEDLGKAIGSKPTGVLVITDNNFKKGILEVK